MERNMDESRKQFEAEMAKLGDCVDMRRAKNGDEEYMAWDVRLAWRFWNLSRAAIEIEPISQYQAANAIPNASTSIIDAVKIGYLLCVEVAGIKVKE